MTLTELRETIHRIGPRHTEHELRCFYTPELQSLLTPQRRVQLQRRLTREIQRKWTSR